MKNEKVKVIRKVLSVMTAVAMLFSGGNLYPLTVNAAQEMVPDGDGLLSAVETVSGSDLDAVTNDLQSREEKFENTSTSETQDVLAVTSMTFDMSSSPVVSAAGENQTQSNVTDPYSSILGTYSGYCEYTIDDIKGYRGDDVTMTIAMDGSDCEAVLIMKNAPEYGYEWQVSMDVVYNGYYGLIVTDYKKTKGPILGGYVIEGWPNFFGNVYGKTLELKYPTNFEKWGKLTKNNGPNQVDLDPEEDEDGDGLSNGLEQNEDPSLGLPLALMGADPYVKDIYVECDYMYVIPQINLEAVVKAFRNNPYERIELHIDAGENSANYINESNIPDGSGQIKHGSYDFERAETYEELFIDCRKKNTNPMRDNIFRYCMFVTSIDGTDSLHGYTCDNNNFALRSDYAFIELLNVYCQSLPSNTEKIYIENVFMHELGHSLGLKHLGSEDSPGYKKPEYDGYPFKSIMNYYYLAQCGNKRFLDYSYSDPDRNGPLWYEWENLDFNNGGIGALSVTTQANDVFSEEFVDEGLNFEDAIECGMLEEFIDFKTLSDICADLASIQQMSNTNGVWNAFQNVLSEALDETRDQSITQQKVNTLLANIYTAFEKLEDKPVFDPPPTATYTISYNANGGTSVPEDQTKTHAMALSLSTAQPSRTGYTFLGWATDDKYPQYFLPGSEYTLEGDTTLYAVWWAEPYIITYNANGGSEVPSKAQAKLYDIPLILKDNIPERTGHTFLGWATSSTATVAEYQPGDTFNENAAKTLYAVWEPHVYTVSYDANGGSNAPASQNKTYNVELALSKEQPTRDGYAFFGWSTSSTTSYASYEAGGTFWTDANTTLYAVWRELYTVSYDANGGIGTPDSQTKTSGVTLALTNTAPTKNGYAFLGWSTSSTALSPTYQLGGNFTTNANTTLYAVWGEIGKTLTPNITEAVSITSPGQMVIFKFTPTTDSIYEFSSDTNAYGYLYNEAGAQLVLTNGYSRFNFTYSLVAGNTYYFGVKLYSNYDTGDFTVILKPCYAITYNSNGGSSVPSDQTKVHDTTLTLSNNRPTKTDFTFLGWSTDSTALSATYQPNDDFFNNENTTLYAVWGSGYTITYNANGGSNAPVGQIKQQDISLILRIAQPTRTGYTFLGWATDSTATAAQYQSGENFTTNATTTLYAVWKPHVYTVSYDANGGSNAPASQNKTYNVELALSNEQPTRDGYAFFGWSTSSTSSYTSYEPGENFWTDANTTLYAVWRELYTVSYDANGGIGTPDSQTKTSGVTLVLSNIAPTRDGYAFLGWSTSNTATSATYQLGGNFTTNANTTLYAVWGEIGKTLTPNITEAVSITSPGQMVIFKFTPTVDSIYEFSSDSEQYTIGYLYNTAGAQLVLTNGYSRFNFTYSLVAGNTYYFGVKLYSNYDTGDFTVILKPCYTITYNSNGGSSAPSDQTKVHDNTLTLSNNRPTKTDFTFLGWSTDSTALSAIYQPNDDFVNNENTTLYAVWGTGFNITYNANGGSNAPVGQIKQQDISLTLRDAQPTRTGYTFLGWATSSTATVAEYQPGGGFTTNATTTLYAVWQINVYSIVFDANGGSNAPAPQEKTYRDTLVLSDNQPTRIGYTFKGWSTSSTYTYASYQPGSNFTTDSDTTLYAVWQANTYAITYNVNGGSGTVSSQTKTHDVSLALRNTYPAKTGYTFLGWSTSETATTATYQPSDSFNLNGDTVLYAVWGVGYTIIYNANGGSGSPVGSIKQQDVTLKLRAEQPSRTGYTFLGWATNRTATAAQYQPGSNFTANETTTLYAVWQAHINTVTYDANGGVGSPDGQTQTIASGDTLVLKSEQPTRDGYVFFGWSTSSTATYASYQAGDNFTTTADMTLYAVWRALYTVSYDANGGTGAPESQIKTSGVALVLRSEQPIREGYVFLGWSTSSTATSVNYQSGGNFSANENTTLYAMWQDISLFTILTRNNPTTVVNISAGTTGRVPIIITAPANGSVTVESSNLTSGSDPVLYNSSGNSISDDEAGNRHWRYTIPAGQTMTIYTGTYSNDAASYTVTATFPAEITTYTITATATTGGTISGGGTVNADASVMLTATANSGYMFDGWYENDVKIADAGATYTFTVTANRTLQARFTVIPHTPGTWEVVTPATCTESGTRIKKCTDCGEVIETEVIPATGHTVGAWETTKAATCTELGTHVQKCTVCNTVLNTETIAVLGHSFGSWMERTAVTCTAAGVEYHTCLRCTAEEIRAIVSTGHTWGSWLVKTSATITADGVEERTCSKCDEKETRAIPAIELEPSDPADFTHTVDDDGKATITDYIGAGGDVVIPAAFGGYSVSVIGYNSFASCSSLTSITIPEGVTTIGGDAFNNCVSLTSITIPEGVTTIGGDAFNNCVSLASITIPDSVASIGSNAFYNCNDLTIYVPNQRLKTLASAKGVPDERIIIIGEETTYTITATAAIGGTVSGGDVVNADASVTLTATANSGYMFDGWYENDVKIADARATYTFTATANRTLQARFTVIPHTPGAWEVVTPATCTESGTRIKKCTDCGEVLETEAIPATGHTVGEWETTIPATYTQLGTRVKKCTKCGEILETESISVIEPEPEISLGDVTGDGEINIFDIMAIRNYIFGTADLVGDAYTAADVNSDEEINIFDIMAIRNHIFGTALLM